MTTTKSSNNNNKTNNGYGNAWDYQVEGYDYFSDEEYEESTEEELNLPEHEGGIGKGKDADTQPYGECIIKVAYQVRHYGKITKRALYDINAHLVELKARLWSQAVKKHEEQEQQLNVSRITFTEIQQVITEMFPGGLEKHAIGEGLNAVKRVHENNKRIAERKAAAAATTTATTAGEVVNNPQKDVSEQFFNSRAGLQFPVLPQIDDDEGIDWELNVFLASVCEYMCAEICELSQTITKKANNEIMTSVHVKTAIAADDELNELLNVQLGAKTAKYIA
jgi:hypothetical protein